MAGRRLRAAVKQVLVEGNVVGADQEVYVTIAGLANNYASYVTTFEEYQAQRYEAASTIYGPHTLDGTCRSCVCKTASLS
jgi:neutral ceramidase